MIDVEIRFFTAPPTPLAAATAGLEAERALEGYPARPAGRAARIAISGS